MSNGYAPRINIVDNQATKAIKSYLTLQQCRLHLVKPGNNRVNAAKCTIQMFKNCFIGAQVRHDGRWFSDPTVGQARTTGARLHQPPSKIADQPYHIRIQNTWGALQLESFPSCTPRNKGNHLQRCGHQGLLGTTWCGRVDAWSLQGPLLMPFILRAWIVRVLCLWLSRPLPLTLHWTNIHICHTRERNIP